MERQHGFPEHLLLFLENAENVQSIDCKKGVFMKLWRLWIIPGCLAVILVFRSTAKPRMGPVDSKLVLRSGGEYASALFFLAGDKFIENKKHGERWIFTAHEWLDEEKVKRYSDGEFIVVSIPNILPVADGLCRYISAYNTWDLHEADVDAAKGNYVRARKWYNLLLHFDACGVFEDELKLRLALLDKIDKEQNREAAKAEIQKLANSNEVPSIVFSGINTEPVEKVPNLLGIGLKKLPSLFDGEE
jgi:hypothetical protein